MYLFKKLLLNIFIELAHLKMCSNRNNDLFRLFNFRSKESLLVNWAMKVCNWKISGMQTVQIDYLNLTNFPSFVSRPNIDILFCFVFFVFCSHCMLTFYVRWSVVWERPRGGRHVVDKWLMLRIYSPCYLVQFAVFRRHCPFELTFS